MSGTSGWQCRSCSEWFASVVDFDRHRVGPWDERRWCKSIEEISSTFTKNDKGRWTKQARTT